MRGGPPRNRRRAASYDGSKTCGTIGGRDPPENTPSLRLLALPPLRPPESLAVSSFLRKNQDPFTVFENRLVGGSH